MAWMVQKQWLKKTECQFSKEGAEWGLSWEMKMGRRRMNDAQ